MGSYYENTNDIEILRQRIDELARIRTGFAAHLGSSLYEVTKGIDEFRWGRESLYDGIAMCDREHQRLLERMHSLEENVMRAVADEGFPQGASQPLCPACGSPVDRSHKFCMICGQKLK